MSSLLLLVALQIPLPPPEAPAEVPVEAPEVVVPAGPCATPRRAVLTWLDNLQPDAYDEAIAAECTHVGALTDKQRQRRVVQLKRVLDSRGVFLRVGELPDEPAHRDSATGKHRVTFTKLVDHMVLEREGERWVLSERTMRAVPALYRETFPFDIDAFVSALPAWTRVPVMGISAWQLTAVVLLVLLGLVVRALVARLISSQVLRVMRKLKIKWGHDLIHSSALPAGTLALAGVLAVGLPALGLSVRIAQFALLGARTVAVVSGVLLVYRLVDLLSAYMMHRADKTSTKLDDQLVPLVRRALKIVVVLLGALFVLQNLEVDVTSILATFGVGTIAFALAAKDTVQNLFGSLTIFLDKPFQIGDWVQTCGVEGVIEEVGFRSTRVRTFYNSQVTVPNGKFTDAIVDNYGRRRYRRCSIKLGLTYDTTPDQMEAFCDGVRAIIKVHPATRKDYYEVHFCGFADSALEVMLYFFFDVDDWGLELRARHEIFLDFLRLANELGVSFAFPTHSIHVESQRAPTGAEVQPAPDKDTLARTVEDFGPDGDKVIPSGQRVHPGFYAGG